jgi:pyruvate kinase
MGVSALPSGASTYHSASINNYCESMIADHPTPPTNNNAAAYHAWAKQNLKYFEHLQSEANTSIAKSSLRVLVPILKFEAKVSNMNSLGAYIGAHQVTWAREWQDFDKTVVVCAKWAVDLL